MLTTDVRKLVRSCNQGSLAQLLAALIQTRKGGSSNPPACFRFALS